MPPKRLELVMSLVRTSRLRPWAPVTTLWACALRVQRPACTALAPTSAIAMAARLTPVSVNGHGVLSLLPRDRVDLLYGLHISDVEDLSVPLTQWSGKCH